MKTCVGLFGTCGKSKWRTPFMDAYDKKKIVYFNPQKENWREQDAVVEAGHLAEDGIILFPITSESYATGSLAETGFSILNAIKLEDRRDIVIYIDQKLDDELMTSNPLAAKESLRARALVKQHLKKLNLNNLYDVESLEAMFELSIKLYRVLELREQLEVYKKQIA